MPKPKTGAAPKKPAPKPPAKPAAKRAAAKKPAGKQATQPAPKKPTQPAPDITDAAAEVTGSQEHHDRFLPQALALEPRDVRPFRLDPSLAFHNVKRAADALLPFEARLRAELPAVDVAQLRELPDLALALCFAASQVDRGGGTSKQLASPLRRAYELRETLLTSARALAVAGVVPAREVDKIQEGRGSLDAAQDNVDLAAFFTRHAAAVRGKTPITAALIAEAAKLGTDLLKVLRPRSAKRDRSPAAALQQTLDARDRLATLVTQRHDLARRAAYWLWGETFDQHVPALQARAAKPRKPAAPPAKKPGNPEP